MLYLHVGFNREEGYHASFMSTPHATSNPKTARTFWYIEEEDMQRIVNIIEKSWTLIFASYEEFYGDPIIGYTFATKVGQIHKDINLDWGKIYEDIEKLFSENKLYHQISKLQSILQWSKPFKFTDKDKIAILLSYFEERKMLTSISKNVSEFFGGKVMFDTIPLVYNTHLSNQLNYLIQNYQLFLLEYT